MNLSYYKSLLPIGAYIYVVKERDREALVCYAQFKKDGTPKQRTFYIGREDALSHEEILHAVRTCRAFRLQFLREGDKFNPKEYDTWKIKRLYPARDL